MFFKHPFSTPGFKHDLSGLNRVTFRYVHLKMNMIPGETKVTKLKTKTFQFTKCTNAGIYMSLLLKTLIPFMSDKHHSHPVISGVTRNLFRANATYIFQDYRISCCAFRRQTSGLLRATKKRIVIDRKKIGFSSAGLTPRFQTTQYSSYFNKIFL